MAGRSGSSPPGLEPQPREAPECTVPAGSGRVPVRALPGTRLECHHVAPFTFSGRGSRSSARQRAVVGQLRHHRRLGCVSCECGPFRSLGTGRPVHGTTRIRRASAFPVPGGESITLAAEFGSWCVATPLRVEQSCGNGERDTVGRVFAAFTF